MCSAKRRRGPRRRRSAQEATWPPGVRTEVPQWGGGGKPELSGRGTGDGGRLAVPDHSVQPLATVRHSPTAQPGGFGVEACANALVASPLRFGVSPEQFMPGWLDGWLDRPGGRGESSRTRSQYVRGGLTKATRSVA